MYMLLLHLIRKYSKNIPRKERILLEDFSDNWLADKAAWILRQIFSTVCAAFYWKNKNLNENKKKKIFLKD
jgi:hypothetical protein